MKKIIGVLIVMLLYAATALPVMGQIPFLKSEIKPEKEYIATISNGGGVVYTDNFVYHIGDTIHITFLNQGSNDIQFGGPPIFRIHRLTFMFFFPAWGYIYPDFVGLVLYTLTPGQSRADMWDQKTSDGLQVLRGIYKVTVPYVSGGSSYNATDTFFIL